MGRLLACLLVWCTAAGVRAETDVPVSRVFGYSAYERETIDLVLRKLGAEPEPDPEGKIIERVELARLEVFEERDPWPVELNAFHTLTHREVLEREVLQRPGEPYRQLEMDETARHLRDLQLSLVLVVAARGSAPGLVRVVVIAKDIWSLRLQWDLVVNNGGVEYFLTQPAETNVLGLQRIFGLNLLYQPLSTSLGAYYLDPRVGGSRVSLRASGNAIVSNRGKPVEGSFGEVTVAQPLWSTRTEWAWAGTFQWRNETRRRYTQAHLASFDSPATAQDDAIPFQYRSNQVLGSASVTRSYGWSVKHDFVFGFEASRRRFAADLGGYDPPAALDFLRRQVPVSQDRIGPAFEWRSYTTSFLAVLDVETLGLQEDFRTGHYLAFKLYPVLGELGATTTFAGLFWEAGYTLGFGDGFARVDVQSTHEATAHDVLQGAVDATLFVVTPRLPFGRVVWSGWILDRYANSLNQTTYLGSNSRLRGFPSNYFVGSDVAASNLEVRTRAVELYKMQLGAVLFWDMASAGERWSDLKPRHSVGIGFRLQLPQFNRVVMRGDLGVPLPFATRPAGVAPVNGYLTFEQAFPVPVFEAPQQSLGSPWTVTSR